MLNLILYLIDQIDNNIENPMNSAAAGVILVSLYLHLSIVFVLDIVCHVDIVH